MYVYGALVEIFWEGDFIFTQSPLILNFVSTKSTWTGLELIYNLKAARTVTILPDFGIIFVLWFVASTTGC
jgi:hypothetical protein